MLQGANAFGRVATGHSIRRRTLLDGFKIDARSAIVALCSAQRLSGDLAIWGAVGSQNAAFTAAGDAARDLRDACCSAADGVGGSFGGLAGRSLHGPHHRTEAGADVGNALLHPVPEGVEEALRP